MNNSPTHIILSQLCRCWK